MTYLQLLLHAEKGSPEADISARNLKKQNVLTCNLCLNVRESMSATAEGKTENFPGAKGESKISTGCSQIPDVYFMSLIIMTTVNNPFHLAL